MYAVTGNIGVQESVETIEKVEMQHNSIGEQKKSCVRSL
jgi:hypothetical protein